VTDSLLPCGWSDRELEPAPGPRCTCGCEYEVHLDGGECLVYGCECARFTEREETEAE
jgi:hypothetical protein